MTHTPIITEEMLDDIQLIHDARKFLACKVDGNSTEFHDEFYNTVYEDLIIKRQHAIENEMEEIGINPDAYDFGEYYSEIVKQHENK